MNKKVHKMAFREYKVLSVRELNKYKGNSRLHSEEQIQQVVKSITEFGFTNPLLVDDYNVIIAGHCRLEAAIRSGMEDVPCIIIPDLTNAQQAALVIADNKLALNASWDFDILRDLLTIILIQVNMFMTRLRAAAR